MALSQRLEIRQSRSLVMTPQLMQAIKLLQLSNLDLSAYVEGELERNPLLERESEGGSGAADNEVAARGRIAAQPGEGDGQAGDYIDQNRETSRSAMEERMGTDLDNVFPDDAPAAQPLPSQQDQPAGYSEWATTGSGGR